MPASKIGINLAARPLRNRRFFALLAAVVSALFLAVSLLSIFSFLAARSRERASAASLAEIRRSVAAARRDRDAWAAQVREWTRSSQGTIDVLNGILVEKSFSWTGFLSRIEEAMPPACVIVQLAPLVTREGRIDARLKVQSPSLQDLLDLIQRLDKQGFKNISVRQEAESGGQWISEVLFTHERTH